MVKKMAFGQVLLGSMLFGLILTIPIIVGFYLFKFIKNRVEERQEKEEEEELLPV
jgi:hypothetical protein